MVQFQQKEKDMNLAQAAKILNIDINSSPEQVRKAFRNMSKKYHPDNHPDDDSAKEMMQKINAANMTFQKHFTQNKEKESATAFNPENTNPEFNSILEDLWNKYVKAKEKADKYVKENVEPQYKSVSVIEKKLAIAKSEYEKNPSIEKQTFIHNLEQRLITAKFNHQSALIQARMLRQQEQAALDLFQKTKQIINNPQKDL